MDIHNINYVFRIDHTPRPQLRTISRLPNQEKAKFLIRHKSSSHKSQLAQRSNINKSFVNYINIQSPSLNIKHCNIKTPTVISARKFFKNKKFHSKSPGIYEHSKSSPNYKGRFLVISPSPLNYNKRNISNELLEGIDLEMRHRQILRMRKDNKIRMSNSNKRPINTSLSKISVFDDTVPDSIIIQSKSPINK